LVKLAGKASFALPAIPLLSVAVDSGYLPAPVTFEHSTEVSLTNPWPLQSFCPAQLVVAVLQSLMPLQALAASQAIFASVRALCPPLVDSHPLRNNAAALAAIAMPATFPTFVIFDVSLRSCSESF
jgi:hypothetical protein